MCIAAKNILLIKEISVKLSKSILTCAIAMALSSAAYAQNTDKPSSTSALTNVERVTAQGNLLVISQTSIQGLGNAASTLQQGNSNQVEIITTGDGNETDTVQTGNGNLILVTTYGDNNQQSYTQDGEQNGSLTEVIGDSNQLSVVQNGASFFGITNEVINIINGDENDITVTQDGDGNWFYNYRYQSFI